MEGIGQGIGEMMRGLLWMGCLTFLLGCAAGFWIIPWAVRFFAAHWH